MSPAPGVNVTISTAAATAVRPTSTGKVFSIAQLERGSTTEAIVVNSLAELKAKTGSKLSTSLHFESAEAFFQEGGSQLILGRIVGANATSASVNLNNASATPCLKVSAKSDGEWGNNLTVQVKAGEILGKFTITIAESGIAAEVSPELATQTAAVEWSENTSKLVNLSPLGPLGNPSVVAATPLTGGLANLAGINTASYEAALVLFHHGLGCGQVVAWGITTNVVQELLETHAEKNNRFAIPDLPNIVKGESIASYIGNQKAAASSLRTAYGARRSAVFSPWALIPGESPSLPTRVVPYSAIQCGIIARNDGSSTPPPVDEPSAGTNGIPRYAVGLAVEYHGPQREELFLGGVNAVRFAPGGSVIETYGNRTLVSPEVEPVWEQISAVRLFMLVIAEGEAIMARSLFKDIDPKGRLFQSVGGQLQAFLESLGGMLYNNPAEAVNVGPSVNTAETIALKQICAAVQVQPSPVAEVANLFITALGV